jgi:uncharacterized protein YutE (UPF0331/DUF86 family)
MTNEHPNTTALAVVRDAVARIRAMLPLDASAFAADRTAREVVALNLFVALQHCVALATAHGSPPGAERTDAPPVVPGTDHELFLVLAGRGVIDRVLASRLASLARLRHRVDRHYRDLDWSDVHRTASHRLDDLLQFCNEVEAAARG